MVRSILSALVVLSVCVSANAGDGWYSSYQEARDAAERNGQPLLLHFHASYCGPCRQMSAQVFSQPEVRHQLRQGIAAVELDVQFHPGLAQQYGATTVPRDIVVFPDGTHETVNVGFKSTYAYMELLRSVAGRGAQFAKTTPTKPGTGDTNAEAEKQKSVDIAQNEIIGLDGFCPMRLVRDRKWVSGSEDLSETYRGVTYYLSTAEEREAFRKNPAKYTPQNLGCDPVVLYSDQQAVTGKIKYGAFFDSKLFLFNSPENRTEFKQNPLKFSLIRHAIRIDDVSGRRFN